jgi:hypothetical protein
MVVVDVVVVVVVIVVCKLLPHIPRVLYCAPQE